MARLTIEFAAKVVLIALAASSAPSLRAQASHTATQQLRLSAFGGATGTFVGLADAKNVGITAGLDLGFRPFFHLYPSVEVRGTYPIHTGQIANEKNILGGLKVEKPFGRLHPYIDILFGRGEIDYQTPFPDANGAFLYTKTVSDVLSGGGGLDYDLTRNIALKADAQYQRFNTPVTTSGHLYSTPVTVGATYRFDFNRHPRPLKYK